MLIPVCVQDSERAGWYHTGPSAKLQVSFILCLLVVCQLVYSLGVFWSCHVSPDTSRGKNHSRHVAG